MAEPAPQVRDVQAIFSKALGVIARGVALEPQLMPGDERRQARRIVTGAMRELVDDLRAWLDQYDRAGTMVSRADAEALRAIFEAAP
jgi:hypothetical protein